MKSYRVTFIQTVTDERTKKKKRQSLGFIVVDMKSNDRLDLHAKAFRQASHTQQLATELDVEFLGAW